MTGWRWAPVVALVLLAPADAPAGWRGIDRAENRIVFAGGVPGADREAHRHLRPRDGGGRGESYEARWSARGRKVPLLRLRLHLDGPVPFPSRGADWSLGHLIRKHPLFEGKAFSAIADGSADAAPGPAEYLVFEAGRYRCGVWRLRLERPGHGARGERGGTLMTGLFCPVSGEVDAGRLASMLARTGIRGVALPEAEAPPRRQEALAELVKSGDMAGLRRIAARGLDPDGAIRFSHPRFAAGRTIRGPMLTAAALYGHVEMTVFLLERGASTGGAAAGAICAAIARDRAAIVEALLDADPALAAYEGCGRGRNLPALALARRLGRTEIAGLLRAARPR